MSVIVTGRDMPKSCGGCESSGTGVCKLWMKSSEINGIGYNRHPDCPLKSVERLIDEIEQLYLDDGAIQEYSKDEIVDLIERYCEVS